MFTQSERPVIFQKKTELCSLFPKVFSKGFSKKFQRCNVQSVCRNEEVFVDAPHLLVVLLLLLEGLAHCLLSSRAPRRSLLLQQFKFKMHVAAQYSPAEKLSLPHPEHYPTSPIPIPLQAPAAVACQNSLRPHPRFTGELGVRWGEGSN
jgi:hypothetical protein